MINVVDPFLELPTLVETITGLNQLPEIQLVQAKAESIA